MTKDLIENKLLFVGSMIAGCMAIVLIVYNTVYSPLSQALATECSVRAQEDKSLMAGISDIKVMIAEIRGDVKYLRMATKNGRARD